MRYFLKTVKFSGSLIINISNNLKLSRKIAIISESILGKYRKDIHNYFNISKELCKKLVGNSVRKYLSTHRSFKVDIKQVEIYLKKNRIEQSHHLEQIVSKSVKEYEGEVFNEIFHSLISETKAYLNGLLIVNKIPIKQQKKYYRNICTKYLSAIEQM